MPEDHRNARRIASERKGTGTRIQKDRSLFPDEGRNMRMSGNRERRPGPQRRIAKCRKIGPVSEKNGSPLPEQGDQRKKRRSKEFLRAAVRVPACDNNGNGAVVDPLRKFRIRRREDISRMQDSVRRTEKRARRVPRIDISVTVRQDANMPRHRLHLFRRLRNSGRDPGVKCP